MTNQELKNQRGSIVVFTVLIMTFLTTLSFAVMRVVLPKLKISNESIFSTTAIYTADSALEWCLYNLRKNVPAPLLAGAVLYFDFDEGAGNFANDQSGSGNNGTLVGGTNWSPGKFGNAISLDGVNDLVSVLDSNSLDLTVGMTLEAWVRPSALNNIWRTVVMKERSAGPNERAYALYAADNGNNPPAAYFRNFSSENRVGGSAVLPLNSWSHVAVTYDGLDFILYVNGVQAGSTTVASSIATSTRNLYVGGNTLWGEWFNGLIDEVRIYNRALSGPEIQASIIQIIPGPTMSNGATYSVFSPASGNNVANCQEPVYDHRAVGVYRSIGRSLEVF